MRLILDRINGAAWWPRRARLGDVGGEPEVSQDSLDHRRLVNQRHEAQPPPAGVAIEGNGCVVPDVLHLAEPWAQRFPAPSMLGQKLARLARVGTVLPIRSPTSLQAFRRARSRAQPAVHPTPAVLHRWALTGRLPSRLRPAPRRFAKVPRRIPMFQPAAFVVVRHGVHEAFSRFPRTPRARIRPATTAWPPSPTFTC